MIQNNNTVLHNNDEYPNYDVHNGNQNNENKYIQNDNGTFPDEKMNSPELLINDDDLMIKFDQEEKSVIVNLQSNQDLASPAANKSNSMNNEPNSEIGEHQIENHLSNHLSPNTYHQPNHRKGSGDQNKPQSNLPLNSSFLKSDDIGKSKKNVQFNIADITPYEKENEQKIENKQNVGLNLGNIIKRCNSDDGGYDEEVEGQDQNSIGHNKKNQKQMNKANIDRYSTLPFQSQNDDDILQSPRDDRIQKMFTLGVGMELQQSTEKKRYDQQFFQQKKRERMGFSNFFNHRNLNEIPIAENIEKQNNKETDEFRDVEQFPDPEDFISNPNPVTQNQMLGDDLNQSINNPPNRRSRPNRLSAQTESPTHPGQNYGNIMTNSGVFNSNQDQEFIDENYYSQRGNNHLMGDSKKNGIQQYIMNNELVNQLSNIDKQQKFRNLIQKFIITFNISPKDGIQFLLENQLSEDEPEEIAQIFLMTEGINKETLGQFFGSPNEKNQKILDAFCRLLDFRNMDFDKALRLFLSRFRLPGESQQIDRIVTIFSSCYHRDNPEIFQDQDSPYIMTYAAIMLNVDAHNTQVEQCHQMKKDDFIRNNLLCTQNMVTREFLEKLWDNIRAEQFETHADNIERIYARMMFMKNRTQFDNRNMTEIAAELQKGSNFLKYGRKGKPHSRTVRLAEEEDRILWKDIVPNSHQASRFILISDITDIGLGSNTTQVMQKNLVPIEFDHFCFSVITQDRTLDLKAADMKIKSKWVTYLLTVLLQRRDETAQQIQQKRRRSENEERISEIWRVDIFPRWEDHWDYRNNQPKNKDQFKKEGFFDKLCSCLSNQGKSQQNTSAKENDQNMHNRSMNIQNFHELSVMPPDEVEFEKQNKSMLLITLWQMGIPGWVRQTIWPLAIGNRLEITQNLYQILLKQVFAFFNGHITIDVTIETSLNKMDQDFNENTNLITKCPENQLKSLEQILRAFIFYRPDIGYIPQVMPNLVMILLNHLQEYQAFCSFINLLHSHHFLALFRSNMREIEWRVQFFDEHLKQRLPLVEQHFKALDLSSELFLVSWLLDLFTSSFTNIQIISRIWDNFLFEGEVYALQCAVAVIEYFQLELQMSTFDEATNLLKNIPNTINEQYFFQIIQDIKISSQNFSDKLQQQQVAQLNPQIHEALLL